MSQNVCPECGACCNGEEICPTCFSSLVRSHQRYTEEGDPFTVVDDESKPGLSVATPDLAKISFVPSSLLSRLFVRVKGTLLSSVIALICILVGLHFFVSHHRGQARNWEAQAATAFEEGDFTGALSSWERARLSYKTVYDKQRQAESLHRVSECYLHLNQFQDALVSLRQAQLLYPTDKDGPAIARCHELLAESLWDESSSLAERGEWGEALLAAQHARTELDSAQSEPARKAEGERIIALRFAQQDDFDSARRHLRVAEQIDNTSKDNRLLSTEIDELQKSYQARMLARSKEKRYIPEGKLDLSSLPKVERRPHSRYRSLYRRRSGSYYRPTYYRAPTTYHRKTRVVRRPRLKVGTPVDYPTHQKFHRRSGYPYANLNRYSGRSYTKSRVRSSYLRNYIRKSRR